jgi:pSer/pThr/pTyr-binding forkhead associated (FHA) protein
LITQQCRIGRNPANDLVINDRAAEDFHAVIMMSDDSLIFIEDQNSRYGTLVNGERISKVQLFPGDEVQIGFSRIDWESRTSFQHSLSEIEIIPNLSVPLKRPSLNNTIILNFRSNDDLDQLNKSDASKELANTLIENEVQMDRIDNAKLHDEKNEKLHSINDSTIDIDNHIIDVQTDSQTEKVIEELNASESNQDNLFTPNQSVNLPIIESINDEVDFNNEGKIENDSSEKLTLELNQEIHQVESHIVIDNQTNTHYIESNNTDDSNTMSTSINLNYSKQENTIIDSSKPISSQKKSDLLRKDSVQIFLAIALTCLLLAAGWLIGQAS